MPNIVCSSCSSEIEESSYSGWDSVQSCPECGAVFNEEVTFTHDSSSKDFSGSFANADGSHRYGHNFDIKQTSRLPGTSQSAGYRALKRAMERVCSKLQLRSEVIAKANLFLFEKANIHTAFKSTHNKTSFLVGGCVYLVCNSNSVPVTIKQVAEACSCSGHGIWALVKRLERIFDLKVNPVTVETLLSVTCCHLENSKACEELANEIFAQSSKAMTVLAPPLVSAIAHAVIAAVNVNKGSTENKVVDVLCKKMVQTRVPVANCIRELKKFMMNVLREIPWIDMKYVKRKNILHYIKDITKFRKNFGAFHAESEDPSWFSKRQQPYFARQEKIKKAQERIKLKQESGTECLENNQEDVGELDKDDEIIEELLEMGCTPEDIQHGFYDSLRTISTGFDILDEEIDSYVRTPEEVRAIKRIKDGEDSTSSDEESFKRRKLSEEF